MNNTTKEAQRRAIGHARGAPVRWTLRRGYFLGRRTTLGSELLRHAKNAVRARQRSAFFLPPPLPYPHCPHLTNGSIGLQCSGDHPTCQRCQQRGLPCAYAAERRMRGPNKPKPPPPLLPDGLQPAAAEGQKTRRRASTMPSAPRRGSLIWGQQQKHKQNPQLQDVVVVAGVAAAPPASPASSAGSGSLGYPPLSESEASPMTPHSSLGSRRPSGVGFPASPPAHVQDFSVTTRSGVLSHVSGGNGYEEDGAMPVDGVVAGPGAYGQDILPDVRMSFESAKSLF